MLNSMKSKSVDKEERRRRALTNPAFAARLWQKGESGNPGGRTRDLAEVVGLAREASPRAIQRMIQLIDSEDERVALMAADKVLERAWGKPREAVPENSVKDMTPEQRRQRFSELLAFAAQLKPPTIPKLEPPEAIPKLDDTSK
jgi:hypothetical protein